MKKPLLSLPELDIRGLLFFRVSLGLILAWKFWVVVPGDFQELYGQDGLLGNCFRLGYLEANGSGGWLFGFEADWILWFMSILCGLTMMLFSVGVYPGLMATIGSICMMLWHDRFQMLWFGWEQYAQVLLFLAIFLPWGKVEIQSRIKSLGGPLVSALIFQIAFIYFFNAVSKIGGKWWDGTAISFALAGLERQNSAGKWLLNQEFWAIGLTYATWIWEFMFPIVLLLGWRNNVIRTCLAFSIPIFHWCISIFMDVGDFRWIAIPAGLLLIPASFWDKLPEKIWKLYPLRAPITFQPYRTPPIAGVIASSMLIGIMLLSNLSKSLNSRTEDPIKSIWGGSALHGLINSIYPDFLPRFSFFGQHWHFFSPNPPMECGFLRTEILLEDGNLIAVYRGEEGLANPLGRTANYLMQYLAIDRNTKKAEVLAQCIATQESNMWHEKHPGKRAKSLSLSLYSYQPSTLADLRLPAPTLQRKELIRFGFDY